MSCTMQVCMGGVGVCVESLLSITFLLFSLQVEVVDKFSSIFELNFSPVIVKTLTIFGLKNASLLI